MEAHDRRFLPIWSMLTTVYLICVRFSNFIFLHPYFKDAKSLLWAHNAHIQLHKKFGLKKLFNCKFETFS